MKYGALTHLNLKVAISYTITASAGANGSITPSGAVKVDYGFDQAFVITAATDYLIRELLVDGVAVPAAADKASYAFTYTCTNVTADHTISVSFMKAPALPQAFYGSVIVNGQPAPVGAQVEARGAGVKTGIEGNPMAVTAAGKYGGPTIAERKLIVQGNIDEATPIYFFIDGVQAECAAPGGAWQSSYPFQSGTVTELNLRVGVFRLYLPLTASAAENLLVRFEARCQNDGSILVGWETSSEIDSIAFPLYRAESPAGPWDDSIDSEPAAGNEFTGATYAFVDDEVSSGITYYYRLEEVAADGSSSFFGPVTARCPNRT
jgi:hypothetical protein